MDELVADAVEDIATPVIQIHSELEHPDNQDNDHDGDAHGTFTHIGRLYDDDAQSCFIAQLQNTAFSYAAMATVPKLGSGTCFEGIMADSGAVKGCSKGVIQYEPY